jgi:pSer/pThr/pTyr-binding forkhead associated (FHA) protein
MRQIKTHDFGTFSCDLFWNDSFMNSGLGRYILKFISGKYQGGEFALEMNQELIIGRSSELEMVLIEDMVSRHHAKITTSADEIYIEDLGSTNGTFVNGEKITRSKLKEGDRILIGTSIIKLVYEEGESNQPPPPPVEIRMETPAPTMSVTGARRVAQTGTKHGGTQSGVLSGVLDQLPLPDLLQLFGSSKKTGGLFITTPGGTEGCIYLREGRVYGAVINHNYDVPVDKAFYRMMCWTSGNFLLDNTASYEFQNPIDETVESMLMESMRIIDETHSLGEDVPAYEAIFRIEFPLIPKLRDLTPTQLDIFQLALAEPSMEAILNRSTEDDIETTKAIIHLIKNNYMQVV